MKLKKANNFKIKIKYLRMLFKMILKKVINQSLKDYNQITGLSQSNMKEEQVRILIFKKIRNLKEIRLSQEIQDKTTLIMYNM
jgi:hypothetical protein